MRKINSLFLLIAAVARAQAPTELSIDAAKSTLTFHLVHKMHKVDGASHHVEGKARLLPDGQAQVMLRSPSESFDSGNSNRDAHLKEVIEAARFPFVELKALANRLAPPARFPTHETKTFAVQLRFHGVEQRLDVPVELIWESADRVRAHASFTISLEAFQIKRPSLMFVPVDDPLRIDAAVVFAR
jgi:polyisoprenoid-binding protein YceI